MSIDREDIEHMFEHALGHLRAGRPVHAEHLLVCVLDFDPRHLDARNRLGALRLEMGRAAAALIAFNSALALDPADAVAHDGRQRALRLLNGKQALERVLSHV